MAKHSVASAILGTPEEPDDRTRWRRAIAFLATGLVQPLLVFLIGGFLLSPAWSHRSPLSDRFDVIGIALLAGGLTATLTAPLLAPVRLRLRFLWLTLALLAYAAAFFGGVCVALLIYGMPDR